MGRSQELLDAAREGDKKVVEKILGQITKRSGPFTSLRRGAGVNVQDDNGYTPLHHACLRGHKEIVALLLTVDASPCIVDKKGATPLHLAAWKGDADVVSMLLEHRHPPVNIDQMTSDQETALLIAAQFGNVDVVARLLDRGADVEIRNMKGESALDLAAQYGRLDTVQHLLQSRPQLVEPYAIPLSRKRMYETTPLHRASKNGHREVVSTLILAGFDPNVRTLTGTALHEAATYGKASVVRILLNKGADLNATDRSGRTVQHLLNEYSEEATRRVRRIIKEHIQTNGYAYESEDDLPPFPPVNDYSPTGYPTARIYPATHKKSKEKDNLSPSSSLHNKPHHSQSFVKKLASKLGIKAKFSSAPNISNTERLESDVTLRASGSKYSQNKSSSSTLLIGNSKFFKILSKKDELGTTDCTKEFDTVSLDCLATLDRSAVVNRSNRSCPGFKTSLPNISENTELSDSLESFHSSDENESITKVNSLRRHHAEAVNKIPKLSIFEPRQDTYQRSSNISSQSVINEYYESYEANAISNQDKMLSLPKPVPRLKPKTTSDNECNVIYENVDAGVKRAAPPVPAARSVETKKNLYENINPPLRKAPDPPKRSVFPADTNSIPLSKEPSPSVSNTSTLSSNDDEAILEDILLSKKSTSFKLKKKLSTYTNQSKSLTRTESIRSDATDFTEASAIDHVDCSDDLDEKSIYASMTGTLPNKKPVPEVKKKILFRNKTFTNAEMDRNSINKDLPRFDKEFLKETLAHYHIRGTGHCINKAPTVEEFIYIFNRDALYNDTPPFEKLPNKRESHFETAICFCKPMPPKHHKSFEDLLEVPKQRVEKVSIDMERIRANKELNETSFKCFCTDESCTFHEKNRESIFNFVVKFSAINKSISTPNISLDSLFMSKKQRLSKINSLPVIEDPYVVVDNLSRKQSNDSDNSNYPSMSQTSTASRPYSVKDISDAISTNDSPDTSLLPNAFLCIRNSSSSEISGKWSLKSCNSNTTVKSDMSFKSCLEELISSDEDSETDRTEEVSDTDTIKSEISTAKRPWVHSDSFRFGNSNKLIEAEVIPEESELKTPESVMDYAHLSQELLKITDDIITSDFHNLQCVISSNSNNNLSKSETSTSGIETNLIDFDTNTKSDDSSLECTNLESGIESETSPDSDCPSDIEYKRLDSDAAVDLESTDNANIGPGLISENPEMVVSNEGLELEFNGGASLERGVLGAVVHSGSGRRRWDEGEGTSEGDALSISSAASSCAPHHMMHHLDYSKVSPTPPKKPPRRNLSVSPTHANSPSGYSYDLRPHARSQDDLDDIQGAKNYLKHGRSVDQYVNSKLSYSEYEEHQSPRTPPVPNPRPSLKTRTQPVAITAMYENVIIKEQNPKRKLRRNAGPQYENETNEGRFKNRAQERSSIESLLDDSMSPSDCERYYEGPRMEIPLSPSHYNPPPTPDHPPPSAKQAENSIHERIRPLSQEYKRRSALRNSFTETEVNLLRAPSAVSVASGATDKSGATDNCVEEYVCDVPFAGLFKGSTTTLDGIGLRPMPAERPKTLKKLKSVYDTSPTEAPVSNFLNITSNGNQHNQNDRQSQAGYGSDSFNGDVVRRRSNTNSSCGDKSLSILSPFDEQEEWAKISEIMASFGSKLVRESVFVSELEQEFTSRLGLSCSESSLSPSCASSLPECLQSVGLAHYETTLQENGYDDVEFINGIIDDADLKEMGIAEPERTKILESTKHLPNKIIDISNNYINITSQNENVDKWLRDIKLEEYSDIFRRHLYVDMERVRRIWDVELTAVLEIKKIGHRKRILASVCGLANGPVSNLEDINADLQCLKNNIQQLKDDIKEKLPENLKAVPPPTVPVPQGETLKRSKKNRPAPQPPKPSDLEIRAPSELLVGVPGAFKTQWKHQPFVLVTGAVTYVANYLGSTVVKELRGTESTKKSIHKLKKSTKEPRDSPDIILSISYRGVKFLNTVTRELVCEHEVRNIHCACQDADDLTHFAYITKDHDTKSHYCHVFRVATMEQATEVILTLGEAFEVAYQMALREQANRAKIPIQSRTPTHDSTSKDKPQNHGRSHSITEIRLNGHQLKLAPIPTSLSTEDFQTTRSSEGSRSPRTPILKAPIASTEEL